MSLALLTCPAHPAEALPLSPTQGPGQPCHWEGLGCQSRIPGCCHPRSQRNFSSGAQQHHPRCHCLPRWMSSRTWGQVGRNLLSLPCGLVLEPCEMGVAGPISQMRKQVCQNGAVREGQNWFSNLNPYSLRCCHGAVSYTHLTLPTIGMLCRSRWSPYH